MATVGEDGKIKGSKVKYHVERMLEALRWAEVIAAEGATGSGWVILDGLAYDHARGAARAALNGMGRKVKK